MQDIVFKLALSIVLASAIFFLLATVFSQVGDSAETTSTTMEEARRAGLEKSVVHLLQ